MVVGSGISEKTFLVHKDLITKHSEYFVSALNGSWKEGHENKVFLADDDPEAFEVFFQFTYIGKIYTIKDGDYKQSPREDIDKEWSRLQRCWSLGEKLLAPSFKDAITDTLISKLREKDHCPTNMHQPVYTESAGPCGMRKLLVDIAVWKWTNFTMSSREQDNKSAQFFFDVAIEMNKIKRTGLSGPAPFEKGETYRYHDHGDASACYKTMFAHAK